LQTGNEWKQQRQAAEGAALASTLASCAHDSMLSCKERSIGKYRACVRLQMGAPLDKGRRVRAAAPRGGPGRRHSPLPSRRRLLCPPPPGKINLPFQLPPLLMFKTFD
jgi:hypothetical protein